VCSSDLGGFINITQNTRDLYFLGTFTSGPQQIEINNGELQIIKNGPVKKFLRQVQQITFNGEYAIKPGHSVTFITERAVFLLTARWTEANRDCPRRRSAKRYSCTDGVQTRNRQQPDADGPAAV